MVKKGRKAMMNLLKDPDNCGKRKNCRPRCLTAQDKRQISLIARQIAEKIVVATNIGNVGRLFTKCEHPKRRKLQRKPWLKQEREHVSFAICKETRLYE